MQRKFNEQIFYSFGGDLKIKWIFVKKFEMGTTITRITGGHAKKPDEKN